MTQPAAPLVCPRCSNPLSHADVPSAALQGCHACGGIWVDAAGCAALAHEPTPEAMTRARELLEGAKTEVDLDAPLACPICATRLERHVLPVGFAIDRCAQHGTWFDKGELKAVLLLDDDARGEALPDADDERPLWLSLATGARRLGVLDLMLAVARLGS